MSRTVWILGIALAVTTATALYMAARVHSQQEEVTTLQQRLQSSEALPDVSDFQSRPAARAEGSGVQHNGPTERGGVRRLLATAAREPTVEEVNLAMESGVRAQQTRLLADPQFRRARLESDKQALWLVHAQAINALRLPTPVADKLMEVLAEHQLQGIEGAVVLRQSEEMDGTAGTDARWMVRRELEQQRRQSEIEALLGPGRYRDWVTFHETRDARREVSALAEAFSAASEPLQSSQMEEMTSILSEELREQDSYARHHMASVLAAPGSSVDHLASLRKNVERVTQSNARLIKLAEGRLSARQLQVYKEILDRKRKWAVAHLEVTRQAVAAGEASGQ